MICDINSPFRRLPANIERKQLLFWDGVRFAVEAGNLAHERLKANLRDISGRTPTEAEIYAATVAATTDAWTIVDSAHRLTELISRFPKMDKSSIPIRLFTNRMAGIKAVRDFAQHVRQKLDQILESELPLWGAITWRGTDDQVAGKQSVFVLVAGTFYPGAHVESAPLGPARTEVPSDVTLRTPHGALSLTEVVDHMVELFRHLESVLGPQVKDKQHPMLADIFIRAYPTYVDGKDPAHLPPDKSYTLKFTSGASISQTPG